MIADQKSSGMTQVAFCHQRQIPLATFQYWLAKMKKETAPVTELPAGFVPMHVEKQGFWGAYPESLELTFPNGVKVSGFGGDANVLLRLAQSWR